MTDKSPPLLASDLEGIIIPEIWIAVAEKMGIDDLRSTTRDIADYDELMRMRLALLHRHNLSLFDIQEVIATMDLLPGAAEFLFWIRRWMPVVIITDSYYELVDPFIPKLNFATIFAHNLVVSAAGTITGYRLRVGHSKRLALRAFRQLGFRTIAVGDSYNDIAMLAEAHLGLLYRPPQNVCADHPEFLVTTSYEELSKAIGDFFDLEAPAPRNKSSARLDSV